MTMEGMAARATRRITTADLARIAVFAALIAALGIPGSLHFGPAVPITLQTLGVMLAGAILGARNGACAVLLFELLVAVGLPLLSGGRGGITVFLGVSAGYLVAWPIGAAVIGWGTRRILPKYPFSLGLSVAALGGIVVVYALGVPVSAAWLGWPAALANMVLFLPGDAIKVVLTVGIARGVHRAWPGLGRHTTS